MKRSDDRVSRDLKKKMVVVVGPRQVGKTTLSHLLLEKAGSGQYLNCDVAEDRRLRNPQDAAVESWLKGVYDGKPKAQQLLVTGSARDAAQPAGLAVVPGVHRT
jgi:ABC-type cobalamin/Fe3+-siderophores transport system ATPase subunit